MKSSRSGYGSSWKNPGVYHYSMSAGLGMALITIQMATQPYHLHHSFADSLPDPSHLQPPPGGEPGGLISPTDVDFQIYVGGIQYHIISGDLKTANKLLNAARKAYGNTADLASLTCHIENEKGRNKKCLKACEASLKLPFRVADSNWKSAALNRVSLVLESHDKISAAINAARMTLKVPGAINDSTFVFRLIQLLGKRAACADLAEAQQVLTEARGNVDPAHMVILHQTLPWLTAMHSTFCSFSHLSPEVLELLHHPHKVLDSSGTIGAPAQSKKDTSSIEPSVLSATINTSKLHMSPSPDSVLGSNLNFLFSAKSPALQAATQFLGGEGSTSATVRP
jgi:hypothetical protein